MFKWSTNPTEVKHVTDTVLKATMAYGKDVTVMMQDGSFKKGRINKFGTESDHDKGVNRGYVILDYPDGTFEEIEAMDIKHLQ